MKTLKSFFVAIILIAAWGSGAYSGQWQRGSHGIGESGITALTVSPVNPMIIFVGTKRAVYKSENGGEGYRSVFTLRPSDSQVRFIHIPKDKPKVVYAVTENGLYEGLQEGKTWKKVFEPQDPDEHRCLAVWADTKRIYLGTQTGLFIQEAGKKSWSKITSRINNRPVSQISSDEKYLYLISFNDVFRLDKKNIRGG